MSSLNMSMNFAQRQSMEQKMHLTAQMIQSVEMLQLPLMVLMDYIQQELNENPVLDTEEENVSENNETPSNESNDENSDTEADTDTMSDNFSAVDDYAGDRQDGYELGNRRRAVYGEDDKKLEAIKATPAPEKDLRERLEEAIRLTDESNRLKTLALLIVGNLDSDGYLRIPLDECFIHIDSNNEQESIVSPPPNDTEIEEALFFVQMQEPAGVGARDIPECLILQLRAKRDDFRFEEKLLLTYFDDLAHNRLKKIADGMGVGIERIKSALGVIRTLNPSPGGVYGGLPHQYIVPDVTILELEGKYIVQIERAGLPKLTINSEYSGIYHKMEKGSSERNYMKDKMQTAKWLIDSIKQRHDTLRRISEQIVEVQHDFLEKGIAHMKPLQMQQIADRVELHVSTISRAVSDKYIQTPQGLFPMKFFFSGGYKNKNNDDGISESNRAIMDRIARMIETENKKKPLSDSAIEKQLKRDGIDIARRTVAKYREKMHISSSRQRKEY